MLTSSRFRRAAALPLILMVLPLIAGCGGGGSSGSPNDADLMVTYFSHANISDVYRNQILEVRFTTLVNPASVSDRTFRVLSGPFLATPVNGAAIVDGNRILFDPTRSQAVYNRDGPASRPDNPFGFDPAALHQIVIPARPTLVTLSNNAGDPIVSGFVANFTTNDKFIPELDQPSYIGPNGTGDGLEFEPPPVFDPNYTHPTLPVPGTLVVAYDAWFFLQFDEAILPSTMDPGVTVLVENLDVSTVEGTPFPVPGTLDWIGDGSRYRFTPTFGFGRGPFRIRVTLTQEITDLAGNPLINAPWRTHFYTEFKDGVKTPGSLIESFRTKTYLDVTNTTAEWDGLTPDTLVSGPISTRLVTIDYKGNASSRETLTDYPLVRPDAAPGCNQWPNGCRVQQSYTAAELGSVPGTLTEYAWGPNSNALFLASHNNIKITMGHVADPDEDGNTKAELVPTFKLNFDGGMPPPHYSGPYDIPQRLNINPPGLDTGFWPYPSNSRPFDYNGTQGVVIDFDMDAGTDCQTVRGWNWGIPGAPNAPGIRNLVATSKGDEVANFPPGGQMYILDCRITLRRRKTTAQSEFYNANVTEPTWSAPIVSPPQQANAASFILELQGAQDPNDSSTYTSWTENIEDLNGVRDIDNILQFYPYLRFRFTLFADLATDTLARIDQITFPFEF